MKFEDTLAFARKLDRADALGSFRKKFHIPKTGGKNTIYFTGNSLGLQPKTASRLVNEELKDWAELGVEGHFQARRPWLFYHMLAKKALARLVGANPDEVVAMNQLTVNLHLMLVTFYRPTKTRYKIITEAGAFSSDQYAFESHLHLHGLGPEALIEVKPRNGESTLRTADILDVIRQHGGETALVVFGAVQYYSGQFFEIRKITEAAHGAGAIAGFDLAHAVGNVPLSLHDDGVDFGVWCGYKYLNSGPGSVGGVFVHERHALHPAFPRLAGWWGYREEERFLMKKGFVPMEGVDGWQVSNFPVMSGAAHLAALEIFLEAGFRRLRRKSILLTGFLEFLLLRFDPRGERFRILTPAEPEQRGCQLSIFMMRDGKRVYDRITKAGVVADWRDPEVIRIAPVPLYNTFEEVYKFAKLFGESVGA